MGAQSVILDRFESADALVQAVAKAWVELSPRLKTAAFSGGRIAQKLLECIITELRGKSLSIDHIHFFWADERCVSPDHPDSNYHVMETVLLKPLGIPPSQVHRIKGESGATAAAREASAGYSTFVDGALDFVFLGMGEDGHIASIFPGDPLNESADEPYRPIFNAPKPPPERVTLSMRAIVAARNVWVLVSGAGKEDALGKCLSGDPEIPLGKLIKSRPATRIFTTVLPK